MPRRKFEVPGEDLLGDWLGARRDHAHNEKREDRPNCLAYSTDAFANSLIDVGTPLLASLFRLAGPEIESLAVRDEVVFLAVVHPVIVDGDFAHANYLKFASVDHDCGALIQTDTK